MAGRKKRRIRVVEWITDEKGQRVEKDRLRKGECYYCGWPAYWWGKDEKGNPVPVCLREHWRWERNASLKNENRELTDADVKYGKDIIKRAHRAGREISCLAVWRAINDRRKERGFGPVKPFVVRRRVCFHLSTYDQDADGYKQGE